MRNSSLLLSHLPLPRNSCQSSCPFPLHLLECEYISYSRTCAQGQTIGNGIVPELAHEWTHKTATHEMKGLKMELRIAVVLLRYSVPASGNFGLIYKSYLTPFWWTKVNMSQSQQLMDRSCEDLQTPPNQGSTLLQRACWAQRRNWELEKKTHHMNYIRPHGDINPGWVATVSQKGENSWASHFGVHKGELIECLRTIHIGKVILVNVDRSQDATQSWVCFSVLSSGPK